MKCWHPQLQSKSQAQHTRGPSQPIPIRACTVKLQNQRRRTPHISKSSLVSTGHRAALRTSIITMCHLGKSCLKRSSRVQRYQILWTGSSKTRWRGNWALAETRMAELLATAMVEWECSGRTKQSQLETSAEHILLTNLEILQTQLSTPPKPSTRGQMDSVP